MWVSFYLLIGAALVALVAPGILIARSFRFSWLESAVLSPLPTLLLYSIITFLYYKVGVFCTWYTLLFPSFLCAVLCFSLSHLWVRKRKNKEVFCDTTTIERTHLQRYATGGFGLALYLIAGLCAITLLYVCNADSPESFVQYFDNLHHTGTIRSFLLSGNWSSFEGTLYPDSISGVANPVADKSLFYPSAWHCIAAFISDLTGASVALSENASIMAFIAGVMPAGVFLLMKNLFSDKPFIILAGSVCLFSIAYFPWRLITFGPLFPNIASLALLPAGSFVFISLFNPGQKWSNRIARSIFFVIALGAIAFTQPNGIFSLALFLIPYCVMQTGAIADVLPGKANGKMIIRNVLCLVSIALIMLIWYICFKLPFLQSIITYDHAATDSLSQSVKNAALFRFTYHPKQLVITGLVCLGVIYLCRNRKNLWLVFSFILACVLVITSAAIDGPIKPLLTGFWYNDYPRLVACECLFAVPLASIGIGVLCAGAEWILNKVRSKKLNEKALVSIYVVLLTVLCAFNYFPIFGMGDGVNNGSAFGAQAVMTKDAFSNSTHGVYTTEEQEFVQEAQAMIPHYSPIINVPADGSAFAFGIDGANTYYRRYESIGTLSEEKNSALIREHLKDISTSEDVQKAVKAVNSQYVILLDADAADKSGVYDYMYDPNQWQGIELIDETTPGFTLVLSSGDMRLYKIETV